MEITSKARSISNEPTPGIQSKGPCMEIAKDTKRPPYWLSIKDPDAKLSDRLCDHLLYETKFQSETDNFDIYAKGLIAPNQLSQNPDGSWSCTNEKTLSQLNGIYVSIHDPKIHKRIDRCWIHNKKQYTNRTLASLAMEIKEASRRKYYPKYLYLLDATDDVTGRKIADFTLYTKHSIPDIGLEVVRLNQAEIPALYKQSDGTYRCTDEMLRFNEDITVRTAEKKSPWHKPDEAPTHELCLVHKNKFVAWDGNDTYIVLYDEYDRMFRRPVDIGGIPRNNPEKDLIAWACLPAPPSKEWNEANSTQ